VTGTVLTSSAAFAALGAAGIDSLADYAPVSKRLCPSVFFPHNTHILRQASLPAPLTPVSAILVPQVCMYFALALLLVAPINVLDMPSRLFFGSTLQRVLVPAQEVSWADFLMADIMTSLSKSCGDFCKMALTLFSGAHVMWQTFPLVAHACRVLRSLLRFAPSWLVFSAKRVRWPAPAMLLYRCCCPTLGISLRTPPQARRCTP
jgi:hypothetical protein